MTTESGGMSCPRCLYIPAFDEPVGSRAPGHRQLIPAQQRWLDYIAHLLEHLVEPKEASE